jgi:subtilisin family serine protease
MRNTYCTFLVMFSVLLFSGSITNPSDDSFDYVITAGGEQLQFIAQPEVGYIIKTREDTGSAENASRFLKSAGDVKISPIRGLGRKGVFVVYNGCLSVNNDKTIKTLGVQTEVQYAAPLFSSNGETVAVIPEIVVRVKPNKEDQVQAICETAGCSIIKRMEFAEQEYLLEVLGTDAEAVFAAVEVLNQTPEVEWAAPNTAFQRKRFKALVSETDYAEAGITLYDTLQNSQTTGLIPNDEYFPMQWHLHNTGQFGSADINAPEAWEITTGDPNIVVVIHDSGVELDHPDLINNLVQGYDFYEDDDSPNPLLTDPHDSHGTACAGLVAAEGNNGIGVVGVAYNCKIMPIRDAAEDSYITWAEEAEAVRWSAVNGADILSNSWGGNSRQPIFHSAIVDVTKRGGIGRDGKGCVVFAAAGNGGNTIEYPAANPEVISVGATDYTDVRCYYSNYGPELDIVAPSAPGYGVEDYINSQGIGYFWTTDFTGSAGWNTYDGKVLDYSEMSGTSASCPIAAGVAALILSIDPNLTNLEVQRILYRSAHDLGEPGWDQYYGWGRVDAWAAVEMALNPTPLYVDNDAINDPGPGDPNISDPNEDGSVEHPFDSIQKAIDFALDTEKIVVLEGRYTGKGNRDIDFGGKILTVRSQFGPATCVIDCQGFGRGFDFHNGEGSDSVLEGFTIINGKGNNGGAINCIDNSSPVIRNCIFSRNSASGLGGAVCNSNSAAALINCTFHANTDLLGGGAVSNLSDGMIIINCILWDNEPGEIFSSGTMDISYSNISGGWEGEGNIDEDPLFADPNSDDYHLKSEMGRWDPNSQRWAQDDVTSPRIDAGDPNSDFSGETWPHGSRINMGAYGGTREASMSLEAEGLILPCVAYIYHNELESAKDYQALLTSYGCHTTLIPSNEVATTGFDAYDLIIAGTDTGYLTTWTDEQNVAAVENSGKPIVGLGNGGYWYFGQLGLSIGNPYGGYSRQTSIEVDDPNNSLYRTPYVIDIPQDRALRLYSETQHIGIYLWPTIPETVTVLGRKADENGYYPLVMEHNRYLLWGFTELPQKMTEIGKTLFINVVVWTANEAWESEN